MIKVTINHIKRIIRKVFEIKDLGMLRYFVFFVVCLFYGLVFSSRMSWFSLQYRLTSNMQLA